MSAKKFVIKNGDDIETVTKSFFKDLKSRHHALTVGVQAYIELHRQLQEDDNVSYVAGLQHSLDELEKHYPFIKNEIRDSDRKGDGITVYRC